MPVELTAPPATTTNRPAHGFDDYVALLKKVDRCAPEYSSTEYTPEETTFLELTPDTFVVETSRSCGWTGSCGDRIALVRTEKGKTQMLGEWCARSFRTTTCPRGQHGFEVFKRGYASYPLRVRVCVSGADVKERIMSRGAIPYSVLEQLPFAKCGKDDYYYDCYALRGLKLAKVTFPDGGRGLEVVADAHHLLESGTGTTRFIFATDDGEKYYLLSHP